MRLSILLLAVLSLPLTAAPEPGEEIITRALNMGVAAPKVAPPRAESSIPAAL